MGSEMCIRDSCSTLHFELPRRAALRCFSGPVSLNLLALTRSLPVQALPPLPAQFPELHAALGALRSSHSGASASASTSSSSSSIHSSDLRHVTQQLFQVAEQLLVAAPNGGLAAFADAGGLATVLRRVPEIERQLQETGRVSQQPVAALAAALQVCAGALACSFLASCVGPAWGPACEDNSCDDFGLVMISWRCCTCTQNMVLLLLAEPMSQLLWPLTPFGRV